MRLPKKAKIYEGYPKLATLKILTQNPVMYFPNSSKGWPAFPYKLKHNELIVLILPTYRTAFKHIVPLALLMDGRVPLNAILTWTKGATYFPHLNDANIELIGTTATLKDLYFL